MFNGIISELPIIKKIMLTKYWETKNNTHNDNSLI